MSRYRIMIVDDDDDLRRVLRMTLEVRYEVVEACDGLDALSKLDSHEPDFAIIDITMPLMDGYQLCEAIRRHKSFNAIQVMFLSAHGTRESIKRGYSVGANLFMPKPVDPARLLRNVDFTIRHQRPPLRPKRHSIDQLRGMAPAGRNPQTPAATSAPAATAAGNGPLPRLLLIDDDAEMLRMLGLALRDKHEVTTASDGLEAIQRVVDYEPDIVLLDIMMPRMNGYQFLQTLRRHRSKAEMPVIVISAKSSQKDRDYVARLGANYFIAKPCRLEQLHKAIGLVTGAPGFTVRPKRMTLAMIEKEDETVEKTVRDRFTLGERRHLRR